MIKNIFIQPFWMCHNQSWFYILCMAFCIGYVKALVLYIHRKVAVIVKWAHKVIFYVFVNKHELCHHPHAEQIFFCKKSHKALNDKNSWPKLTMRQSCKVHFI